MKSLKNLKGRKIKQKDKGVYIHYLKLYIIAKGMCSLIWISYFCIRNLTVYIPILILFHIQTKDAISAMKNNDMRLLI